MKQWHGIVRVLWASPCSVVGLALAVIPLLGGGRARWQSGALEITYRESKALCGKLARKLPFRGIVFGHVILAVTRDELHSIGPHERVHVRCTNAFRRWTPNRLCAHSCVSADSCVATLRGVAL